MLSRAGPLGGVLWDPAAYRWRSMSPYPFGVPGSSAPLLREVESVADPCWGPTPLTPVFFTFALCPDMQVIQSYSIFINPVSMTTETSCGWDKS